MSRYSNDVLKHRINTHIKRLYKERGFTLKNLAAITGMSFQQVGNCLQGDNWFSVAALLNLSRALDVPVKYFYETPTNGSSSVDISPKNIRQEFTAAEHELLEAYRGLSLQDQPQVHQAIRAAVEKKINIHIGGQIRKYRKPQMARPVLAGELGVIYQQVAKYESGVDGTRAGRLQQISNALKVPIECFFEGLDNSPLPQGIGKDFTIAERALVMNFRYLTPAQQKAVPKTIKGLAQVEKWRKKLLLKSHG